MEILCPIALIISIKNGTQLHTANTGQNETLHQRVKTMKESEIAPAECNNVARKKDYNLSLGLSSQNILANVTLFRSKLGPSKNIISSTTSNAIENDKAMINLLKNN